MTDDFTKGLDNMNHIHDGRILATKADLVALHTKSLKADLNFVLENASGGGNWRRIIHLVIAQLSAKEVK